MKEEFSIVRGYLVNAANTEEPLEVPELFPVKKPKQAGQQEEPLLPPTVEDLLRGKREK
jgi:hypothetical protein